LLPERQDGSTGVDGKSKHVNALHRDQRQRPVLSVKTGGAVKRAFVRHDRHAERGALNVLWKGEARRHCDAGRKVVGGERQHPA